MVTLQVPGVPELMALLVPLVFYLALTVLAVRITLHFMDYPASEEMQNRVALLEREVAELQQQIEEGGSE